mmetsp:Transcript_118436/g.340072  ORF Transcript_118436/g.340072 Transcript_118436/m.340072 type:complete len:218 (+) Transcript_118436:848-1501(+)
MRLDVRNQVAELRTQAIHPAVHAAGELAELLLLLLDALDGHLVAPEGQHILLNLSDGLGESGELGVGVGDGGVNADLHVLYPVLLALHGHRAHLELVPELRDLVATKVQALVAVQPQGGKPLADLVHALGEALQDPVGRGDVGALPLQGLLDVVDLDVQEARPGPDLLLVVTALIVPSRQLGAEGLHLRPQGLPALRVPLDFRHLNDEGVGGGLHLL